MSSLSQISVLEALNEGNFFESRYDSENREFVLTFRNNNIKLPKNCYRAHGKIYDGEEDIKVCRVLVM